MILIEFLLAPTVPSTEAEEHRSLHVVGLDVKFGIDRQRGVGHVVHDADGEVVLGLVLGDLVVNRLDHRRRELLGGEAIAARKHAGAGVERSRAGIVSFAQRGDHVEYRGSPIAPGSLQRSSTAMFFTVFGNAPTKSGIENGL